MNDERSPEVESMKRTSDRKADARWAAVLARDANPREPFVYGVKTTGIVCRPGCASRTPRRPNVVFFETVSEAIQAGFRLCRRCHAGLAATDAMTTLTRACRLLAANVATTSTLVARQVGVTPSSLVRSFRAAFGITPQQFRRRTLADQARALLPRSATVTEAIYAAGFSTSSRFYEGPGRELGMLPRDARAGGRGHTVRFALRPTSLGVLTVVWTTRGISDVFFAEDDSTAVRQVSERLPAALRVHTRVPRWLEQVVRAVEQPVVLEVPLDVQGTAFQERVWQALRRIPVGETRTYAEIAQAIGSPGAARAVGTAVGQNPVAVLVPCHRVVRKDGALGGYRWGLERKAELLRRERSAASGGVPR